MDVLAIDVHTLECQRGYIIDRHMMEFRVFGPVFVKKEEDLLCSTESKDR